MGTFDSGVEDAEAEPVEVIVRGREVVHVEQHRRRGSAVPAAHPLPSLEISRPAHHEWAGERLGLGRRTDSCGAGGRDAARRPRIHSGHRALLGFPTIDQQSIRQVR